jgi:parvulin-like peptidyl-prolyl isomerase
MQFYVFPKLSSVICLFALFMVLGCDTGKPESGALGPSSATTETAIEKDPGKRVIARVYGLPITERMVLEEAEPVLLRRGYRPGTVAWRNELNRIRPNLLDSVITNTILLQISRKKAPLIQQEDEKVEEMLAKYRRMFATDEFFKEHLRDRELSEAGLKERLRLELKREAMLKAKSEECKTKVTFEQCQAYYESNPQFFVDRVRLSVITIYMTVQDTTLERAAKKGQIEFARQRLDSGVGFATVAREFSRDDPMSKETGGDLGYLSLAELDPPVRKVVENMPVGEVAGPIESGLGFYIVKLTARGQSFDEAMQQGLQKELVNRERAKYVRDWMLQLRTKADIKILDENYSKSMQRR